MNMQLRQCFDRAMHFKLKKARFCPAKGVKKKPLFQNLASFSKKAKLATMQPTNSRHGASVARWLSPLNLLNHVTKNC